MPMLHQGPPSLIVSVILILGFLTFPVNADEGVAIEKQIAVNESGVASPQVEQPKDSLITQSGMASWYGGSFVGKKTASGERYRSGDRTAAHRTLPFGTYVRVINLRNKKSAIVRINNRGPHIKGRIIDLSRKAATDLGIVKTGVARVQMDVLSKEVALAELAAL